MITLKRRRIFGAFVATAALFLAMGCQPTTGGGGNTTSSYKDYLYMTDTVSGKVYTYDPSTQTVSSSSIASTGQAASGEIQFYNGIGYVCVGSGTNAGVYYFDPSATNPSFTKISNTVNAEYITFYNSTTAYVSVATSYTSDAGGIYTFNPTKPSYGLTQVASSNSSATKYMQGITVGPDSKIYVAEYKDKAIAQIDPTSNTVTATFTTSASNPTGLTKGTYNGSSGVFVANVGGSIDFIASGSTSSSATPVIASSVYPGRIVQLSSGNLIATGYDTSYAYHSYLVTLSGATATVSELKTSSGSSFGSLDIAYNSSSGLVYIPVAVTSDYINYTNYLYVLDANGNQKSYSPVSSVMPKSAGISNVSFYQ
jgi:hypothetical protein